MSTGGHSVRAFRPSRFAQQEELDEQAMWDRQAKVEFYALRAQAGLPLFEESPEKLDSKPSSAEEERR